MMQIKTAILFLMTMLALGSIASAHTMASFGGHRIECSNPQTLPMIYRQWISESGYALNSTGALILTHESGATVTLGVTQMIFNHSHSLLNDLTLRGKVILRLTISCIQVNFVNL